MPDGLATELRIYCICGQKMKVSESMFGLPGKCVACRQKIRIPRPDQLPSNVTEVYLKDHPEFLRKAKKRRTSRPEIKRQVDEPEGVVLGEPAERVSSAILDILEPLRVLCSLEHKITRQLDNLSDTRVSATTENERTGLQGYLDRVRRARIEMDEQLRQRLMEVAIELSSTQEKIVQVGLSARTGEIGYADFRDTTDTLRRRRDSLDRLQQNLRGWLSVNDPHAAGGYTNVSFDSIPDEGSHVLLPPEPPDLRPLLDQHVEGLREAFLRRERAERRLKETERLRAEGQMSSVALNDCLADCEAERGRAEAEISFRRKRLEQLSNDAASDVQTTQACLESIRKRHKAGELDKGRLAASERELLMAQRDCARAHDLISRALLASAAPDVPPLKGTFLKRLPHPVAEKPKDQNLAVDSWIALGSALAMGLAVVLPMVGDLSPISAYRMLPFSGQGTQWILVAPLVMAVILAAVAALPWRGPRGFLLAVMWLGITIAMTVLIHEAGYSSNALAVRFRQGAFWAFRPGMLFLIGANVGVLAAACVNLAPFQGRRSLLPILGSIALAVILMVGSDMGGYLSPRLEISAHWTAYPVGDDIAYDTSITLANQGGRTAVLSGRDNTARNAFVYSLERRGEGEQWDPAGSPTRIERASTSGAGAGADLRNLALASGDVVMLRYRFAPGEYRVRLEGKKGTSVTRDFLLDSGPSLNAIPPVVSTPKPNPAPPADESALTTQEPTTDASATTGNAREGVSGPVLSGATNGNDSQVGAGAGSSTRKTPNGIQVELRGMALSEKRDPQFLIIVHLLDGSERRVDAFVGDVVYGEWTVKEFNSERQTVTLGNGTDLQILNRGQRVDLF